MLIIKLSVLTLCCCVVYGSQSSEEVEAMLADPLQAKMLKKAVKEAYEDDKLSMIYDMLTENQKTLGNVTVIGSQNVYDSDGNIKEILTAELHIPGKKEDGDDEDDDEDESFDEIRELFTEVSKVGLTIEIASAEYDSLGDLVSSTYLDQDVAHVFYNGLHLLNKTIKVDNAAVVDEAVKKLRSDGLQVAVHKFGSDNKLKVEESNVIPEYVTSIIDVDGEVDENILQEVQKEFAEIYLKHQNEKEVIPSKLSENLGKKFPEIIFFVFSSEPSAWSMEKIFRIVVVFDFTDWIGEEDADSYTIIGVKKNKN